MTTWLLPLLLSLSVPAQMSETEARGQLLQAQDLARRSETAAAIDVYQAVLAAGFDGVAVRYNLGTLYLQQGDLGHATHALRQAYRMDPLDSDVRFNLQEVRRVRADQLAGDFGERLGRQLPPLWVRAAFALSLVLLAVVVLTWPRQRRWPVLVSATGVVTVAAVLLGLRLDVERTREAVVLRETPAQKEPAAAADVAFQAHPGLFGDVVDEDSGYVRLRMENGLEAWLVNDALAFVP